MSTQLQENCATLSERLSAIIDRCSTDVATKVGFAVVAGLPDDLRAKLVEEMAPVLRVARNPELAHQLEGPVASELGEWLAICDLAGQGKND